MITHQEVLRVTQTTSKHLPDTLRHLPDNPKSINVGIVKGSGRNFLSLLGKPVVNYNDVIFFMCFQLLFHKYPESIRCQTASWNPSDTPRHNTITSVFSWVLFYNRLVPFFLNDPLSIGYQAGLAIECPDVKFVTSITSSACVESSALG